MPGMFLACILVLVACGDATTTPLSTAIPTVAISATPTSVPVSPVATITTVAPIAATTQALPTAASTVTAIASPAAPAATPPTQPADGPGGTNYSHQSVVESVFGTGEEQYYLFEPADPAPKSAPLIIFVHG